MTYVDCRNAFDQRCGRVASWDSEGTTLGRRPQNRATKKGHRPKNRLAYQKLVGTMSGRTCLFCRPLAAPVVRTGWPKGPGALSLLARVPAICVFLFDVCSVSALQGHRPENRQVWSGIPFVHEFCVRLHVGWLFSVFGVGGAL